MPREIGLKTSAVMTKAIIHKLYGEIPLVEQGTIEYISIAFLKFIIKFLRKKIYIFFTFILCNFVMQTLQYAIF